MQLRYLLKIARINAPNRSRINEEAPQSTHRHLTPRLHAQKTQIISDQFDMHEETISQSSRSESRSFTYDNRSSTNGLQRRSLPASHLPSDCKDTHSFLRDSYLSHYFTHLSLFLAISLEGLTLWMRRPRTVWF